MPRMWQSKNEKKEAERLILDPTAWYQEIHFGIGKQKLWFNAQLPLEHPPCHHIERLYCSWAEKLSPDDCINKIECILLEHKHIFGAIGIKVQDLETLDREIRERQDEAKKLGAKFPKEP